MEGDEGELDEKEEEDREGEEQTILDETQLGLLGVEPSSQDDPFIAYFNSSVEVDVEQLEQYHNGGKKKEWRRHEASELGIVQSWLPGLRKAATDNLQTEANDVAGSNKLASQKKKKKNNKTRTCFPPMVASRAPTAAIVTQNTTASKKAKDEEEDEKKGDDKEEYAKQLPTLVNRFHVKQRLATLWDAFYARKQQSFTPLQEGLFPIFNEYLDLLYTNRDSNNARQIRTLYIMHALNHVFKTRDEVLINSAKIKAASEQDQILEKRDQGFTRPKVLILVPFRNAALDIVKTLLKLTPKIQSGHVANKARLLKEFGLKDDPIKQDKPQDYLDLFKGNIDDCFRVGISFTRQAVKLYSEFYASDIIVASPLGLRMLVGARGDKKRDYDFLASIEMVIVDQADVLLMQNWEHVTLLFDHFNLRPHSPHKCDFSRTRYWALQQWSKYFRQTLVFSGVPTPELHALINRQCYNMRGTIKISQYQVGTISRVVPKLRQVFQKLNCSSIEQVDNARFNYFVDKVYPALKAAVQKRVFIFIPSYFDYVRLRNWITKEQEDEPAFVLCCEYSSNSEISRARTFFQQGRRDFMLYTERFHFFRRYKIKGIANVVFYALPQYPHFYSEVLNFMAESDSSQCTVLYSKFDMFRLEGIVGSERAKLMLSSDKQAHMFI
ncbi:rRNA-binding ribosome biosynthesis protein utp25 [Balamuthia mandrillaris]